MPDVGLAPPPPVDVASQMKPSPAGGFDLGALMSGMNGGSPPPLAPDLTPKIMQVEPMLSQIARQVPALGPDVDRLNVELKSRMGGLPSALAGLAGSPSPAGVAGPPVGSGPPTIPPQGGPAGGPAAPPAVGPPPMPPNPAAEMGAMDTAMQIEVQLPPIGQDDPTLMPYIQGFIARMRIEVPKVVQGDTEAVNPPPQTAPTDSMLSQIPVTY